MEDASYSHIRASPFSQSQVIEGDVARGTKWEQSGRKHKPEVLCHHIWGKDQGVLVSPICRQVHLCLSPTHSLVALYLPQQTGGTAIPFCSNLTMRIQIPILQYLRRHKLQHANLGPVHEKPETKAEISACVQRHRFQRRHFPGGIAIGAR